MSLLLVRVHQYFRLTKWGWELGQASSTTTSPLLAFDQQYVRCCDSRRTSRKRLLGLILVASFSTLATCVLALPLIEQSFRKEPGLRSKILGLCRVHPVFAVFAPTRPRTTRTSWRKLHELCFRRPEDRSVVARLFGFGLRAPHWVPLGQILQVEPRLALFS